jgi:hypothetical protein
MQKISIRSFAALTLIATPAGAQWHGPGWGPPGHFGPPPCPSNRAALRGAAGGAAAGALLGKVIGGRPGRGAAIGGLSGGPSGASNDDRVAASMFSLSYPAAIFSVRNLSIAQIQAIEGNALSICAANPQMPAARALRAAIRTHGR